VFSPVVGVPLDCLNQPAGCYKHSVQQSIARNAWPLMVLWFFGLFLVMMRAIPGRTCRQHVTGCRISNVSLHCCRIRH
jgi:hypothetical protein